MRNWEGEREDGKILRAERNEQHVQTQRKENTQRTHKGNRCSGVSPGRGKKPAVDQEL